MATGTGLPVQGAWTWLRLTQETTYAVYNSSNPSIWVVMTGDNPFTTQQSPVRTVIRSADTTNRRRQNIASKVLITGNFNTPIYPSQANFLLGISSTLTGTAPYNLGTVTADFFDGQTARRCLGGMCVTNDITCSADQQYASMAMSWQFRSIDDTALASSFPPPTCSQLPQEEPYLFNELAGTFTFAPTTTPVTAVAPVTIFDQFNLAIRNTLSFKHYEHSYIEYCNWAGRDIDLTTNLAYVDTSWRGYFEAQVPLTLNAEFNRSGTQNLTLNFQTRNYLGSRPVQHPLAGVVTQGLTAEAFFDCSTSPGTDFSFTALYS